MNSISLKNIRYKYPLTDHYALDGVSFDFEEGKFYGIIGPNGSGKSTICNLMKGLIPSFYLGDLEGTVEVQGKPVDEWEPEKLCTKVGYIFQNPFTQISGIRDTVFEEIAIGLENLGIDKEQMIQKAEEITKRIGIYDLIEKNPNELSGGQRQRVAFASILAMDTDIYVIDEPTSQLDPDGTESVFKIIRSLKEQKKTVILVEHKIELMAKYADEIIVLKDGKIIKSGPAREVLSDYDLVNKKVAVPQTVLFGHEMERAGKSLGKLPITIDEAEVCVRERMRGEQL
ncbi:MAG: ABC transporter ATP-binding protein [Lachnospiraceae bacterium]|nr:ABC transporter ATP-binding protein [Lachnospiraceae bacterium]